MIASGGSEILSVPWVPCMTSGNAEEVWKRSEILDWRTRWITYLYFTQAQGEARIYVLQLSRITLPKRTLPIVSQYLDVVNTSSIGWLKRNVQYDGRWQTDKSRPNNPRRSLASRSTEGNKATVLKVFSGERRVQTMGITHQSGVKQEWENGGSGVDEEIEVG